MLARTPSGDIAIPMSVVQDPVTIAAQKLTDEFNLWLGSWQFDTTQGFPWLQAVLGVKSPNMTRIRQIFRKALLATPRVTSINFLKLAYDPATRNLSYAWSVQIDTGAIVQGGAGPAFVVQ